MTEEANATAAPGGRDRVAVVGRRPGRRAVTTGAEADRHGCRAEDRRRRDDERRGGAATAGNALKSGGQVLVKRARNRAERE